MDAKITLSFNEDVIIRAKNYARSNNISLSRLTEILLAKVSFEQNKKKSLEDIKIADWVNDLSQGEIAYSTKSLKRKSLLSAYYSSKK